MDRGGGDGLADGTLATERARCRGVAVDPVDHFEAAPAGSAHIVVQGHPGPASGSAAKQAHAALGAVERAGAPRLEDGASLLRSATPGPELFFKGFVTTEKGEPVAGAEVDVWHSSPVGLYENQDKTQAEMNLRGVFTTLADGSFSFRTVKPAGYPVPTEGPTGALLRAQKRHNMRPAHLHFLIHKPGFKTIASQVYDPEDPHLETDSQFGVTKALIGNYQKTASGYALEFSFVLEAGESWRPKAPITGKVAA